MLLVLQQTLFGLWPDLRRDAVLMPLLSGLLLALLFAGWPWLLIGLGINGLRTGTVLGRIGSVQRATNPVWFWFRVTLYVGLGVLALCDAWRRDG